MTIVLLFLIEILIEIMVDPFAVVRNNIVRFLVNLPSFPQWYHILKVYHNQDIDIDNNPVILFIFLQLYLYLWACLWLFKQCYHLCIFVYPPQSQDTDSFIPTSIPYVAFL